MIFILQFQNPAGPRSIYTLHTLAATLPDSFLILCLYSFIICLLQGNLIRLAALTNHADTRRWLLRKQYTFYRFLRVLSAIGTA